MCSFLASLPSLSLCFQPRSRPFVWLLARTWIRKMQSKLLYDRSVGRIFIELWLKSISCYMIDQLCVFLYSRGRLFDGLRYCHENFLQYFHPIYVMRDGFKKVSVMCDRYPLFATLINRIPLFPPRMKKEKKKRHRYKRHFR